MVPCYNDCSNRHQVDVLPTFRVFLVRTYVGGDDVVLSFRGYHVLRCALVREGHHLSARGLVFTRHAHRVQGDQFTNASPTARFYGRQVVVRQGFGSNVDHAVRARIASFKDLAGHGRTKEERGIVFQVLHVGATFGDDSTGLCVVLFVEREVTHDRNCRVACRVSANTFFHRQVFRLRANVRFGRMRVLVLVRRGFRNSNAVVASSLANFRDGLRRFLPNVFLCGKEQEFLGRLLVPSLSEAFALSRVGSVAVFVPRGLCLGVVQIFCVFFSVSDIVAGQDPNFELERARDHLRFLFKACRARPLPSASNGYFRRSEVASFLDRLFRFLSSLREHFHSKRGEGSYFARGFANFHLSSRFDCGINAQAGGGRSFFFTAADGVHVFQRRSMSQVGNNSNLFNGKRCGFQLRVKDVFK